MKTSTIETRNVENLDVYVNPHDIRRDLHNYLDFVADGDIKRAHRSNALSKGDTVRLAKKLDHREILDIVKEHGRSNWIDYIETIALKSELVDYDTKGVYMGYSSSEPSFPDNYIDIDNSEYEAFVDMPIVRQEKRLFDIQVDSYDHEHNELITHGILGILDSFSSFGCGTRVLPLIRFDEARRLLFTLMQHLETGRWYATESLIAYLKENHRYFLVPENPKVTNHWDKDCERYSNFSEGDEKHRGEIQIRDADPDGFERVEGRFVERFLEGIPLSMGYVDVAYARSGKQKIYPSRGCLKAFRINKRFLNFMKDEIPETKVTVQPNFEVVVDSAFYNAKVANGLAPWTDLMTVDTNTVFKIRKNKVLRVLANNHGFDVVSEFEELSSNPLPQNVRTELEEWTGRSEVFTLYTGGALFEGDKNQRTAREFTVQEITPEIRIVKEPLQLVEKLERAMQIPLSIKHSDKSFRPLPLKTRTVFGKDAPRTASKRKTKEKLALRKIETVSLIFPDREKFELFLIKLLETNYLMDYDKKQRVVRYFRKDEDKIKAVLNSFKNRYAISINEKN